MSTTEEENVDVVSGFSRSKRKRSDYDDDEVLDQVESISNDEEEENSVVSRSTGGTKLSWEDFIRMKGRDKPSPSSYRSRDEKKTSRSKTSTSNINKVKLSTSNKTSRSRDTKKKTTTTSTTNVFLQMYGLSSTSKGHSAKKSKTRTATVSPVQSPRLKRKRCRSPSPKLTPPDQDENDVYAVESVFESALQKEKARKRSQSSSQRSSQRKRMTTTTTTTTTSKKKKKKREKTKPMSVFTSSSSSSLSEHEHGSDSEDQDDNIRPFLPNKFLRRSPKDTPPLELTSKVPPRTAYVPKSIHAYLADYQIEGVKWLFDHYVKGEGAILGDDMGLGKTVQTITLISAILQKSGEREKDVPQLRRRRRGTDNSKRIMIVMPSSVLDNWYEELERWGYFSVIRVTGPARKKQELIDEFCVQGKSEILLITYAQLRIRIDGPLSQIRFTCVFYDEIHKLRNDETSIHKGCRKIQSKRHFGLTGTAIQNCLLDLWSLFQIVNPNLLGDTKQNFKEYYMAPVLRMRKKLALQKTIRKGKERLFELQHKVRGFLLRRTKKDKLSEILPKKQEIIMYCKLTPLQAKLYKAALKSPDFELFTRRHERCDCGRDQERHECCYSTGDEDTVLW